MRPTLDAQEKAAAAAGKPSQQADLSAVDNRSLATISLNQDNLFSARESHAAKQTLESRNRASILAALKQSQSTRRSDPAQPRDSEYLFVDERGRAPGSQLDAVVSRQCGGELQVRQQDHVDAEGRIVR